MYIRGLLYRGLVVSGVRYIRGFVITGGSLYQEVP